MLRTGSRTSKQAIGRRRFRRRRKGRNCERRRRSKCARRRRRSGRGWKGGKEAKELDRSKSSKPLLEQARPGPDQAEPAKGGKRSESLFDRAKREKLEREQAEVREMREKRRVAAEKRKSAGREAVGTHILSQKAIARIHAERQRAREEQLQPGRADQSRVRKSLGFHGKR